MAVRKMNAKLTPLVCKDRAAMLSWQLQFGFNDIQPVGDTYVQLQGGTPFYFEDFSSNAISTRMRIGGGDTTNAVLSRPLGDFNHNPRGLMKDGWRAAA